MKTNESNFKKNDNNNMKKNIKEKNNVASFSVH